MSLSDFIKENVYLPYFRRHSARARSQQVLLGVAIGALVIAGMVGWWLWSRRGRASTGMDGVTPSGA
jgi:hypothetical protein